MPIRFRCPQCQSLLSIAARKAGEKIDCPKCTQHVIVPKPPQPTRRGILETVEPDEDQTIPVTAQSETEVKDWRLEPPPLPRTPAHQTATSTDQTRDYSDTEEQPKTGDTLFNFDEDEQESAVTNSVQEPGDDHFFLNGLTIRIEFHEGTIAGYRRETQTRVHGRMSTGKDGRSFGYVDTEYLHSTEFFLIRDDGLEIPYSIDSQWLLRDGQRAVSLHASGKNEEWIGLFNLSSGEWYPADTAKRLVQSLGAEPKPRYRIGDASVVVGILSGLVMLMGIVLPPCFVIGLIMIVALICVHEADYSRRLTAAVRAFENHISSLLPSG